MFLFSGEKKEGWGAWLSCLWSLIFVRIKHDCIWIQLAGLGILAINFTMSTFSFLRGFLHLAFLLSKCYVNWLPINIMVVHLASLAFILIWLYALYWLSFCIMCAQARIMQIIICIIVFKAILCMPNSTGVIICHLVYFTKSLRTTQII